MKLSTLQKEFRSLSDPSVAKHSQRFFKTGPGEYGEGDQFLGIRVPVVRVIAKKFKELPLPRVLHLLTSEFHEERLLALVMLVNAFNKAEGAGRDEIYSNYLENTHYINSWDLVDSAAYQIVGRYLLDKNRDVLPMLAESNSLWERRISIIASFQFIRHDH